ncbi:MAG: ABC transporter ATP-binding protein [Candidatus Bathyarchaeia archaeon]
MNEITIECHNLTKTFGGLRAVDDVSVTFEAGKVTALIGPNGAGKTTLFHLISGALRPDNGRIFYRGRRIDGLPPWRVAQMGIGRLFQDVRVFGKLSALDNVRVAFRKQIGENPLWSVIRRPLVNREEQTLTQEARRWLTFVGLIELENALAEDLSYGQQKLLAIARLLAAGADVFLLDEPTAGVNPEMVRSLLALIRRLAEEGKTVVVIEHNMNVVMEIADWCFFMDEGQIVAFGLPDEVLGDRTVKAAYLGI